MTTNETIRRSILNLHTIFTGRHVLESLEELNHTQWLAYEDLMELQREKQYHLLAYAAQYVPYYQRIFKEVGFHPQEIRDNPAAFNKIPILTKSLIRENFSDLQTTEPGRRKQLSKVTTSGSTGQPLIFLQDHGFRDHVTADIQRHLGWVGWEMGQRHAYLWGGSFEETLSHSIRTRLLDWEWNRFLTNAFTLTEDKMAAFTEQVIRLRPRILFGYASSLLAFAQFVRRGSYPEITFDGIISSAEVLPEAFRQVIEKTFKCPVLNRYGSKELGGIASECTERNGLHVSVENNLVEILNDGQPAQPGEVGSLIVTNLNNWGMPFIRYSIGDEASWAEGSTCPCGRAAPRLKSVEGRIVDQFVTQDGRASWAGFAGEGYSSLLAHHSIKQFQIVQESLNSITVLLVTEGEVPRSLLKRIERTLQAAFGENITVTFDFPEKISPMPS